MGKKGLLGLLFFFTITTGYSQISVSGIPESFSIRTKQIRVIPHKELDTLNAVSLIAEDTQKGINNRYGIVNQLNIDIKKEGISFKIDGRGTIWQFRLQSPNARSLGITFRLFLIPDEASVFIYDESHTHILGAFTKQNNNKQAFLSIADMPGNNAIIEYFEPINPEFEGELIVASVSQAYREITYQVSSTATSRIGINCPLGANWQEEKHAVCRMIFQDSQSAYYCTGFFVNNTSRDGKPYFMTANHCISTSLNASTLVIYFNYENSTCSSNNASEYQTLSGSSIVANNNYSDFSLVLMNNIPPESYKPYCLGWNALDSYSASTTCIHHPQGTPKCISVDNNSPVNYSGRINWDNSNTSNPYTHWQVYFDQGITEGGSSGSPLLDANKRVIGQLHGGDPNGAESYYGKFSASWNYSPTAYSQLKAWLDPANTGETSLEGMYRTSKPISLFKSNVKQVCISDTIKFTDLSANGPQQWEWKISPNTYQYTNGTTGASRNPIIAFQSEGFYTITLITKNNNGSDTLISYDYISIVRNVTVSISGLPSDSTICGCNLVAFKLSATGAVNYVYSLEKPDKFYYNSDKGDIIITVIPEVKKEGSFNSWIKVKGRTGSCIARDSVLLKISMPKNDNIEDAIQLIVGRSQSFTNKCASFESEEPHPSLNDCNSQNSWCPYNNSGVYYADSILNGTLWYTFVGSSSGKMNIRASGSNSRIAVYETDSYQNIIPANSSKYNIVAANDNASLTDNTAFIKDLNVVHGKTYWLQLDGDGHEPGDYKVELWSGSVDVHPKISDGNFKLIISNETEGMADIRIISGQGMVLQSVKFFVTPENNSLPYNLSYLSSGVYVVQVFTNGNVLKSRFVIAK